MKKRCRRDGADARGLSFVRARRSRRTVGAGRHGGIPGAIARRSGAGRARATVAFHGPPVVTVRPGRVQALRRQSGVQRRAFCEVDLDRRATAIIVSCRSRSTTTGRASRPTCVRKCSSRSCGSTTRAIRTRAIAGSGLSIARDIARSHGGDITLADSPLGGLRATCACRSRRRRASAGVRSDRAAAARRARACRGRSIAGMQRRDRRGSRPSAPRWRGRGRAPPWCGRGRAPRRRPRLRSTLANISASALRAQHAARPAACRYRRRSASSVASAAPCR